MIYPRVELEIEAGGANTITLGSGPIGALGLEGRVSLRIHVGQGEARVDLREDGELAPDRAILGQAAARALGVSRNTARAQLSSVFSKTGVNRQSQLVKLVADAFTPYWQ